MLSSSWSYPCFPADPRANSLRLFHRNDREKAEGFCLLTSNAIRIYCIFCIKYIFFAPFSYSLRFLFSLEVPFYFDFFNFPYFFAPRPPFWVVWQIGREGKGSKSFNTFNSDFLGFTRARPRNFPSETRIYTVSTISTTAYI